MELRVPPPEAAEAETVSERSGDGKADHRCPVPREGAL